MRSHQLVVVLTCFLLAGLLVPAPTLAGDGATFFIVEPDELDVDPGEEFELEVVVSEHGDLQGNGIDRLSFDIEYDTELLTATDVEHESMLAAGDDNATVDGTDEIDDEAGVVSIDQEREPPGDGARASEPAVTITLIVDDDAEAATTSVDPTDASAILVTDFPQAAYERSGTVHIDGGDESDDSADEPDGVTLAASDDSSEMDGENEVDAAGEDESAPEAEDETDAVAEADESIPGFAVTATIAALAGLVAALLVGRRVQ